MTVLQPTTKTPPLQTIEYFVEWGAKPWREFAHYGIYKFIGEGGVKDRDVLEIGTRYGKIATLFALMGARVKAIDIDVTCLVEARNEAKKYNVHDRTEFIAYDGNLSIFPDASFDIIFSKSVLVAIPELESFLRTVNHKLKPNGKIVFIENGYGNFGLNFLRKIRYRRWNPKGHFFSRSDMHLFREVFNITEIKSSLLPPVFLICGVKRQ